MWKTSFLIRKLMYIFRTGYLLFLVRFFNKKKKISVSKKEKKIIYNFLKIQVSTLKWISLYHEPFDDPGKLHPCLVCKLVSGA